MAKNSHRDGRGPSQRQLRVGELIRRTLAEALARGEIHDAEISQMSITVSEVRVTPDLRQATVHVLPLGGVGGEQAVAALNRNMGELRHHLDRNLSLRYSPKLTFLQDTTFDQMDETRRLLDQDAVRRDIEKPDSDDVSD